jgi:GNAT superfamily N-acetyltransferase
MGGDRRVLVRRLEAHEVELHRDLRLRALGDAPESFGETVAEAAARAPAYWEDLTRSVTEPGRHVMFLAWEGRDSVGSTYGLPDRDRIDAGRVGGMWVDPAWRRRGVGRLLMQALFGWARDHPVFAGGLSRDRGPAAAGAGLGAGDRRDGVPPVGGREGAPGSFLVDSVLLPATTR